MYIVDYIVEIIINFSVFYSRGSGYSWTYPTAECVYLVRLTLMRKVLLEPLQAFTLSEVLGVFLILLAGTILAFIVAGINRFVLFVLGLYREVFSFYVPPVYSLT